MRSIIVDDELPSRQELEYFIKTFSNIEIVNQFDDGVSVLKYVQSNHIDVIFLDINMPNLDGMNLAKILYEMNPDIKVVFITAYKEYALDAFEIHAFDYLVKPYSKDRIVSALERLESSFEENSEISSDKMSVLRNDKIYVINIKDIYYIKAFGRGVAIFTKDGEYTSRNKISEMEKKLPVKEFYKSHRSFIVNLGKVKEIKPWFNDTYVLKLKDIDKEIPVSRNNIKRFREILSFK